MNVFSFRMACKWIRTLGFIGLSVVATSSLMAWQAKSPESSPSSRPVSVMGQDTHYEIVLRMIELTLENDGLTPERFTHLAKDEVVASALIEIYHKHAVKVEPDCEDLFDVKNGYVTATISMESFGKINSTGFDPRTNGARPITNREVKDPDSQRIMRLIQSVLGAYHPKPIQCAKFPDLSFKFEAALNTGVGAALPSKTSYICVIKPVNR